jgi:hypothetical protein
MNTWDFQVFYTFYWNYYAEKELFNRHYVSQIPSDEFLKIHCGMQVMATNILTNRHAQKNWTRSLGYLKNKLYAQDKCPNNTITLLHQNSLNAPCIYLPVSTLQDSS